ncbi:peptidylprolyl isomerase [Vagococcus penaei]|uniref:Peptidyl-prolyl cis-trans isomerase n=1 Tax=Vagococcus penaei TaxID=633807 RepID=A0A1Q2D589_9ENTE|nr:peptidylprolyl isomerase [Vagococcus penaei]AQP53451.1 peptidylprolyl isomerase [Vagococcus penaei]RSU00841.1 peptidylprolyl isomerase [Vagococcus penaei]
MKRKQLFLGACTLLTATLLLSACGTTSKNDNVKKNTSSTEKVSESVVKDDVDLNTLDLPQLSKDVAADEDLVEMETSEGNIKIKLFPKLAPKAVENFMTHAKDGYYNNVSFHRVIKDFMIQSGDPDGTGSGGESIWKEEFAPEISNQLYHVNGALAVARTSGDVSEKTQGSQFYIVSNHDDQSDGLLASKYPEKIIEAYKDGGQPNLDFQYSVFGQVIEGQDIVDKIAATETSAQDKPTKDITIKKIAILQEAK